MPIWAPAPLVGAVARDAVRYALAVTTVLLAGLLLGFDAAGGVPGALAGALLIVVFAFALSWIFTAGGLRFEAKAPSRVPH